VRRPAIVALWVVLASASVAAREIDDLGTIGVYLGECIGRRLQSETFGGRTREVTFSYALRRDGSLIGPPTRTFSSPAAAEPEQARFIAAILAAATACTPLPLSAALGGAIAGRRFTQRIVARPGQELRL
jgi:hypothetical protein